MELLISFFHFLKSLVDPVQLNGMAGDMGGWLYVVLFAIIFCETGLVVTPFLPGDSLLFALGALAAMPNSPVSVWTLFVVIFVAGVMGDAVNYSIGRYFGDKVLAKLTGRWIRPEHLDKTQKFYEKHGGITIVLARFIPIIRTFAPFVAGVSHMPYRSFGLYNVLGALVWVVSILAAGFALGNVPVVQKHFELIVILLVLIPGLPALFQVLKAQKKA